MAGYSWRNIIVITLFLLVAAWQYFSGQASQPPTQATTNTSVDLASSTTPAKTLAQLRAAANDPNAKFWTHIQGTVIKNLKDDQEGDRHQKFLVEVAQDLTLLVSHNIDVAERVPVREGDLVNVQGEYVWNNRGGVIHWTHHDPKGRKAGGWIELKGKRYD
ncbi:DUF3465 domain-containing protein [uncultured Thiothrix sp.]|uniref:DUF3465 domain-containing protein n=1 Tax=uncultured Thiothrix sp. TaxID=223185 RepID=UPI002610D72F|nr:DUF3465 domain-containing protein [uncultured Thiothrix sp.]HMT93135.1 DUF3465 domain-containing protein [Thiolinea sp.]